MATTVVPDYLLFDADNHFYEPRDAFTSYIDPAFKDRAMRSVVLESGEEIVMAGDTQVTYLAHNIFESVGRPGSLRELLMKLRSGASGEDAYEWEEIRPEYRNRDDRLAIFDTQHVEGALLFPSLAVVAEPYFPNFDDLYANLRAFNRYLDENWGFAYKDRLYGVPLLSLKDLPRAVEDLEWVLERGARVVSLMPGPVCGRSPGDPYFDPFWSRANEAGISIAFHLTDSGYNRRVSIDWGERPDPPNFEMSAWQWMHCDGDRPIMETLSALVFDNLFGRFPNLKAISVENGCEWFPYFVRRMDKMRGMARNGPWRGGRLTERPSEIIRKHILVTPYPEDDISAVSAAVGPESLVLGSDWPHAEGAASPVAYANLLSEFSPEDQELILRRNGLRIVGRELP